MHNRRDEPYHQDSKLFRPSPLWCTADCTLLSESIHRNLVISNQSPLCGLVAFSSNRDAYSVGISRLTRIISTGSKSIDNIQSIMLDLIWSVVFFIRFSRANCYFQSRSMLDVNKEQRFFSFAFSFHLSAVCFSLHFCHHLIEGQRRLSGISK